jgi:nitroreductase/dihydropteridine reductase
MSLLESMNWRYATKKMNGEKVNAIKLNTVLEAIRLAPSSMGLQPFQVLVINNKAIKKEMKKVCYNQPQIIDSACMLVFAVWEGDFEAKIDKYITNIAATRGEAVETLEGFKKSILGNIAGKNAEQRQEWAARQAYIALGVGLTACAIKKIDSTPMEGFIPAALDEVLGLKEKGLKSVVMLAIGNRDEADDPLAKKKKVRQATNDFFIHMN